MTRSMIAALNMKKGPAMRQLFWNKQNANAGSVWEQIGKSKQTVNIDDELLTELFAEKAASNEDSAKKPTKAVFSEPAKKTILDSKRGQNVGIVYARLSKKNPMKVLEFVRTIDAHLDLETVRVLRTVVPTDDEKRNFQKLRPGELDTLTDVDKFVHAVVQIKMFERNLGIMEFRHEFNEKYDLLDSLIRNMHDASTQLRSSPSLQEILLIVLQIGNRLNQGTGRGNAAAFRIQSLTVLKDTRAFSSNMNLLEFIAETVLDRHEREESCLEDELRDVPSASRLNVAQIEQDFKTLLEGIKTSEETVMAGKGEGLEALQDWVNSRRVKVSDLQAKFAQAKDEFLQTVVFFGEDKKTPPDVLFAIFRDFLTDFAHARDKMKKLKKKRSKSAKTHTLSPRR